MLFNMKSHSLLLLCVACLLFAVIFVWVSNPYARVIWCAAALFGLAHLAPSILMDVGLNLARDRKRYLQGMALIQCAQKISFLGSSFTKSMAPICISHIELLQQRCQDAVQQAKQAMDTGDSGDRWERKFYAASAAGAAYYALKDYKRAAEYLRTAWELYGSAGSQSEFRGLVDLKTTIHADNLDLLAKIALIGGNLQEARSLFDRSTRTRQQKFLKGCARAYEQNVLGTFALVQGDVKEATDRVLSAATMLPQRLKWYDHRVAVDILCNLKRIRTKRSAEMFDELWKRFEPHFHAIDKQFLLEDEVADAIGE